jgi:hypothetical protein
VLGLQWKHLDLEAGTIKIEQRVWHQDLDRPKTENSRRVLVIGDLVERYWAKLAEDGARPDKFVFQQKRRRDDRFGIRVFGMHCTRAAVEGVRFPQTWSALLPLREHHLAAAGWG